MLAEKKSALLILFITVLVTGCMYRGSKPRALQCPEPSQDCMPAAWKGMAVDTSEETSKVLGYYYSIQPVGQLNSPSDEWSLSFVSSNRAAFGYDERGQQRMMIVRMVKPERFTVESGIGLPLDGNVGSLTLRAGKALVAATIVGSTPAPQIKSSTGESLAPVDQMVGISRIFTGDLADNVMTNVKPFGSDPDLDIYSWQSHPALSPKANAVFFASDRNGGFGGTDIWFSVRQGDGSWSPPVNCGSAINTQCDELTPFVPEDGKTLLFASSGNETVGGYDLFSAAIRSQFWQDLDQKDPKDLMPAGKYFEKARNLRPPVNTPFDELFPSCPGDCDSILYYSSNQAARSASLVTMSGGFDLYVRQKIVKPFLIKEQIARQETDINIETDIKQNGLTNFNVLPFFTLGGKVYNSETNEPVADAQVIAKDQSTSEKKQTSTGSGGDYEILLQKDIQYEITAQASGLFFDSYKLEVLKEDSATRIEKNFFLPTEFILRINFPTDLYNDPYKYTLDSNGVETNKTWEEQLWLLASNIKSTMENIEKIMLVGHTDDVASEEYNQRLGKRRVDFVIAELVKCGVDESLLVGRSAGELEPLPRRPGEDLSLYRKRLRRVAIGKIMKR